MTGSTGKLLMVMLQLFTEGIERVTAERSRSAGWPTGDGRNSFRARNASRADSGGGGADTSYARGVERENTSLQQGPERRMIASAQ